VLIGQVLHSHFDVRTMWEQCETPIEK